MQETQVQSAKAMGSSVVHPFSRPGWNWVPQTTLPATHPRVVSENAEQRATTFIPTPCNRLLPRVSADLIAGLDVYPHAQQQGAPPCPVRAASGRPSGESGYPCLSGATRPRGEWQWSTLTPSPWERYQRRPSTRQWAELLLPPAVRRRPLPPKSTEASERPRLPPPLGTDEAAHCHLHPASHTFAYSVRGSQWKQIKVRYRISKRNTPNVKFSAENCSSYQEPGSSQTEWRKQLINAHRR